MRIAPRIETHKIKLAKRFQHKLPKRTAFIFEDPKDADEFYNYVNTKHDLAHKDVTCNVPFEIDEERFYFSFHEVEKKDKTLNLIPFLIEASLDEKAISPMFEWHHTSRKYHWYIAVTVDDENMNDCLKTNHEKHEIVVDYLRNMRKEYLDTSNYLELLLQNPQAASR